MKKVLSILLCVLWMGFIFYNSSQDGTKSNGLTNKIVDEIITICEKVQQKDSQNIKVYSSPNVNQITENSRVYGTSLTSIVEHIGNEDRITLNKEVRKAAHAFEFLVLAVLLCNAFSAYGFKADKALIYILFIVLFYAVMDEFHQIHVVGRGSSVKDVLIDFAGGIIGTFGYYVSYYVLGKIKKKR